MKVRVRKYILLLLAGCFLSAHFAQAQNADINFVKAINPQGDKSVFFRGLNSSVYPVTLGIPLGTFLYGEIKKDNCIRIKAYEQLSTILIAGVAAGSLKIIIDRKRPYEKYDRVFPQHYESGHSFPSAHSALAFATATSLSIQYKKWYVVVPAYVWAAGCGFSRIYLGEHYPTDVIAGAAIGAGSAIISHWLTKKIFKKPCSVLKEPA